MSDPKKDDVEEPTDPNEEVLSPDSATGNYRIATDLLQELLDGKKIAASAARRLIKRISDDTPVPKKA